MSIFINKMNSVQFLGILLMYSCCQRGYEAQEQTPTDSTPASSIQDSESLKQVSKTSWPLVFVLEDELLSNKEYPGDLGASIQVKCKQNGAHVIEMMGSVPMLNHAVLVRVKIDGVVWTYEKLNDTQFTLFTSPNTPPGPSRDYSLLYKSYEHPGWYLSYAETGTDVRPFAELDRIFKDATSARMQVKTAR
jgi:hypothetical protein